MQTPAPETPAPETGTGDPRHRRPGTGDLLAPETIFFGIA